MNTYIDHFVDQNVVDVCVYHRKSGVVLSGPGQIQLFFRDLDHFEAYRQQLATLEIPEIVTNSS